MKEKIFPPYSVLMSVYERENPDFLRLSVDSIFAQTLPPDEFVLVLDGPLTKELETEVDYLASKYTIKLVVLEENIGLGNALNEGLKNCCNEIVARMDSDDICLEDRMEKQLSLMLESGADILSSSVLEFKGNPNEITGERRVPCTHFEIVKRVRTRNPFNHPATVYKKSVVIDAGGYMDYDYFEDYELFARMLKKGAKSANHSEPLVLMRTGDGLYKRRGGFSYVKKMCRFYKRLRALKMCSFKEVLICQIPRVIIAILPVWVRRMVYQKLLRG